VGGEHMSTVVDGQSAKAVLDSPAADTALEMAHVDVNPVQPVNVALNGQSVESVLDTPDAAAVLGHPIVDTVLGDPAADSALDSRPSGVAFDSAVIEAPGGVVPNAVVDDAAPEFADDYEGIKLGPDGQPEDSVTRHTNVTETLVASVLVPEVLPSTSSWDVVTEFYHGEYKSLVRLAVLLVHDVPTAEEVVQDAFEAMHTAQRRLRDSEKALSYLRQSVVNKSRSVDRNAPKPAPDEPSAEHAAMALIERTAVVAALRVLPDRQREAIVLRYYADFSEADIAAAMGISRGAVKSHTARGMTALRSILEQET
jgi:RNA polymerase sigma-70 factor (sigma-E family)